MIIKGQARGRARQLAAHLLRADQNESIQLYECRGTLAQDVEGALIEMEARGMAVQSQRPLYHASVSPEAATPLTDQQIRQAVDLLEDKLGLHGQPRVVVLHRKNERDHVHVVWSRIEAGSGTSISYSWNYRLHEKAARELETLFGHRPIESSRGKRKRRGSRHSVKDYELRQAERSGFSIASISSELTALWHRSKSGAEFRQGLEKSGYVLARGDRRVFVVIDRAGSVHSLARRIDGADTRALNDRLKDTPLNSLPSVADVRHQRENSAGSVTLPKRFALAGREVTHRATADRTPLHRTVRQSRANLRALVAPATGLVIISRAIPARMGTTRLCEAKPFSIYRSRRSVLLAEYASKIAVALRNLPPQEIDAALAALRSEREAALDRLNLADSGLRPRKGRRRKTASSSAYLRMRYSLRRRAKPP